MPKFKRGEVSIYYQVIGNGIPIIFTHGASWDHEQWVKQVEHFKKYNKVITWDVRGHGQSTLPEGEIDPEDFIEDLIALMNHLKLKRVILCGLSMGGHISLRAAIKYPDRIMGLVLIGTPCSNTFNFHQKFFIQINRFSSRFIPKKTNALILAKMLSRFNPSNFHYIYKAFSKISQDNWNKIWNAVTNMESKDDLHRVKCPTLILIGDHDFITNFQQSYIHANIVDSKLKVISRAHHCTNLDNPYEVNDSIGQFMRSSLKL